MFLVRRLPSSSGFVLSAVVSNTVRSAFVLGAGLGTRLGELTRHTPKPLLPIGGRPLITWAFDHLLENGVERIMINTHHCAEKYAEAFPTSEWRGVPLTFRHEPVRLETGGGLKNIEDWAGSEPLWIYNGDVLTRLPLDPILRHHRSAGCLATLGLRSTGGLRNVNLDADGAVVDLRDRLGNPGMGSFLFSGIYLVSPGFFRFLESGKIESVVEAFLRAIEETRGSIGGVVVDENFWYDLGTPPEWEEVNRAVDSGEIILEGKG